MRDVQLSPAMVNALRTAFTDRDGVLRLDRAIPEQTRRALERRGFVIVGSFALTDVGRTCWENLPEV